MDMRKKSSPNDEIKLFEVRDAFGILIIFLALAVAYSVSVFVLQVPGFSTNGLLILSLISISVNFILAKRLSVIWGGVKFDLENRTLAFPGGGVAADTFLDYFKPNFLLQYLARVIIDIDDIQQISYKKRYKKTIEGVFGSDSEGESLVGLIEISGAFGSAIITFKSLQKGEQLYANLAYHLEMGQPVVIR